MNWLQYFFFLSFNLNVKYVKIIKMKISLSVPKLIPKWLKMFYTQFLSSWSVKIAIYLKEDLFLYIYLYFFAVQEKDYAHYLQGEMYAKKEKLYVKKHYIFSL